MDFPFHLFIRASVMLAIAFFLNSISSQVATAQNQEQCTMTPEGRICKVQQPITAGAVVTPQMQQQLGLVTVGGGCSGTLLNRYWVLTARHCVTVGNTVGGVLQPPSTMGITAAWAPTATNVVATRFHEFRVNVPAPERDIVLIYLGRNDFGSVNSQLPYIHFPGHHWKARRLGDSDSVNQYGRGFSSYASGTFGTPGAVPSGGGGTYRTAVFQPSNISATSYDLRMNGSNQVGHGGDSGGPTVITQDGRAYIAGVQSTCRATGYVAGAPIPAGSTSPGWMWATGISLCSYVSVEPFVDEIRQAIQETPECKTQALCTLPSVLSYVLKD